jgi:hypothetical protein
MRPSRRADALAALTAREREVLAPSDTDSRRVIAAIKYLES